MATDLSFFEAGAGPPVVLVHAGVADGRMWEPQVAPLSEHYRVIVPDLRGFGRTPTPEVPFSHATDLRELAAHLDVTAAAWVGCSMGGAAILDLALETPDLVNAMVLSGAAVSGYPNTDPVMRAGWNAAEEAYEAGDLPKAAEIEMRMWLIGPNRSPQAAPVEIRDLVVTMLLDSYLHQEGDEIDPPRPAMDHLEELAVPTLVLCGTHDQRGSVERSTMLADRISGARYRVIVDSAHLPNLEHPEHFNQLVLDFLGEVYE